jgi:phosphatidate cytidylyltransferase
VSVADDRSVDVPLKAKTSDLGVRTLSAFVMLFIFAAALLTGGDVWRGLVYLVGAVCFGELVRLVLYATRNWGIRIAGIVVGAFYIAEPTFQLSALPSYIIDERGRTIDLISPVSTIGVLLVVSLIGVVIATDVGAYFTGRTFGGPKIAPKISPSKTWSGLIGGMLTAGIWALLVAYLWLAIEGPPSSSFSRSNFLFAAIAGALLAIVAQAGDFLESWLKRRAGVKDSSRLIPGHGGVFDRIDGLLPVILFSGLMPFGPF